MLFFMLNCDYLRIKVSSQCGESGIRIPDPDLYPSRIPKQKQKRGEKKLVVIPF